MTGRGSTTATTPGSGGAGGAAATARSGSGRWRCEGRSIPPVRLLLIDARVAAVAVTELHAGETSGEVHRPEAVGTWRRRGSSAVPAAAATDRGHSRRQACGGIPKVRGVDVRRAAGCLQLVRTTTVYLIQWLCVSRESGGGGPQTTRVVLAVEPAAVGGKPSFVMMVRVNQKGLDLRNMLIPLSLYYPVPGRGQLPMADHQAMPLLTTMWGRDCLAVQAGRQC